MIESPLNDAQNPALGISPPTQSRKWVKKCAKLSKSGSKNVK